MQRIFQIVVALLFLSPFCFSQDPMPVVSFNWQRAVRKAQDPELPSSSPARSLLPDDKYFQRKAREARTDNPLDPSKDSEDARSAQMDKNIQESQRAQTGDAHGYLYTASVRNEADKTAKVIFWEYRFTEIAKPNNVARRQFICGVNLKKGDKIELSVFSLLGPSDTIDAQSLEKTTDKLFDEKVLVNRIEFSDDTLLQRNGWKLADVKSAVERATSTPWGKEICRPL